MDYCTVGYFKMFGIKTVVCKLLLNKVLLGDIELFILRVAADLDDLHAVKQRLVEDMLADTSQAALTPDELMALFK